MAKQIKGGGARKYGRSCAWCQSYRNQQQRERNKGLKLARHIRKFPQDGCARMAMSALPKGFQRSLQQ
jgi:hypothetical protein